MRRLLLLLACVLLFVSSWILPVQCEEAPCLKCEVSGATVRVSWSGADVVTPIRDMAPSALQLIVAEVGGVFLPPRAEGVIRVEDWPPGDFLLLLRAVAVDENIVPPLAFCGPFQAKCVAHVDEPDVVTHVPGIELSLR